MVKTKIWEDLKKRKLLVIGGAALAVLGVANSGGLHPIIVNVSSRSSLARSGLIGTAISPEAKVIITLLFFGAVLGYLASVVAERWNK